MCLLFGTRTFAEGAQRPSDTVRTDIMKRHRDKLYETADVLDKKSGILLKDCSDAAERVKPMIILEGALRKKRRKKRGKKRKSPGDAIPVDGIVDSEGDVAGESKSEEAGEIVVPMSPLFLPKPTMPLIRKAKKKRSQRQAASVASLDEIGELKTKKKKRHKHDKPASPSREAAVLDKAEGLALMSSKRRKKGEVSRTATTRASSLAKTGAERRRITFDLESTEIVKFKRLDRVDQVVQGKPGHCTANGGHTKSALRFS